jgi:hypothetical protein
MQYVRLLCFGGAFTAFAFLGYTLANLRRLGIRPTHPRVLVEAALGLAFAVAACVLWFR